MSKNFGKSFFSVLILLLLMPLLIITLSGCGGGGSSGGGTSASSTSATPSTPTTNTVPTPSNKGVLITITKADKSVSAVLVGVSKYLESAYDLPYAANDPVDIKNSLIGSSSWAGASVSIQNDVNITKSMIQSAVENAKNNTASDGLFIFSFSGNGGNSSNTGYLVPYYTDGNDFSQMISEDELRNWLNDFSSPAQKLILLDSSAGGAFIGKSYGDNRAVKSRFVPLSGSNHGYNNEKFVKALTGSSNTFVLTAASGTQAASEATDIQNGTFTYFVCEGLGSGSAAGGADLNSDAVITAEELASYVAPLVGSAASSNGFTQTVQSYDNYPGSLIIKIGGESSSANKGALITITKPDGSAIAVLAGVTDYPGTVNDLNYTANDAIDLRDALNGSGFWAGAAISTQNNVNVTKAMIQDAVTTAKNNIAVDGLFVFMYSGHGTSSGSTGYLVPYDGVNDVSKRISEDELKTWLDAFNSNVKKYVLLDSCYSGSFIDKSLNIVSGLKAKVFITKDTNPYYSAEKFAKSLVSASNTCAMTASKGSELSWETSLFQNGVFMHYVTQGLGSGGTIGPADANSSSTITAEEMGAYTPALVTAYVASQNPQIYDNYPGEMRVK